MPRPDFHSASMQNTAMLTGGWALIAAGVLAFPLPGPFSSPAITLGGLILARRSPAFRHGVAQLRARFPESSNALTQRSRGWPRSMRYLVLRTDPRRVH
jgi:hypothetical protein